MVSALQTQGGGGARSYQTSAVWVGLLGRSQHTHLNAAYRWHLDLGHFLGIRFVVQTVAEQISEITQCALDCIRNRLFLTLYAHEHTCITGKDTFTTYLVKSLSLALRVFQ